MKINILISLILFCNLSFMFPQNKRHNKNDKLDQQVYGYVINNNKIYLVTDNGFLSVYKNNKTNKQWEDYYGEIYHDSTIINPNTLIGINI